MKMENTCRNDRILNFQKSNVTIEMLNNYCLLEIFTYLPIKDKLLIASVCKRWQMLSYSSWSSFKKLDLHFETWMSRIEDKSLFQNTFDRVIQLSGKYLVTIELTFPFDENLLYYEDFHFPAFRNICKSCPNMRELVFLPSYMFRKGNKCTNKCNDDNHKLVPWLKPHSKRLTKLAISTDGSCDTKWDFMILFLRMKNLKSFMVTEKGWLTKTKYLLGLPLQELEEIIFKNVDITNPTLLRLIISKCVKLRSVGFIGCRFRLSSTIRTLERYKTLRVLNIQNSSLINPSRKILSYVRNLADLEILNVELANTINDEFLKVVSENCKHLTNLKLSDCKGVTDKGVLSITSLKKLRYLHLKHLKKAVRPPFRKMSNLEVLVCKDVPKVDYECFSALVRQVPHLRFLAILEHRKSTTKFLTAAMKAMKNRKNNRVLSMKVFVKKEDMSLLDKMPPLLHILPLYQHERDSNTIKSQIFNMISEMKDTFFSCIGHVIELFIDLFHASWV